MSTSIMQQVTLPAPGGPEALVHEKVPFSIAHPLPEGHVWVQVSACAVVSPRARSPAAPRV